MNTISDLLAVLTVLFSACGLVSVAVFGMGGFLLSGLVFPEVMRRSLKVLFLVSGVFVLAVELVFTLVYWTDLRLSPPLDWMPLSGTSASLFELGHGWLFQLIDTTTGFGHGVGFWLLATVAMALMFLIPALFLHARVTQRFKRLIFNTVAARTPISHPRFISSSPHTPLPSTLVCHVVARNKDARNWIMLVFSDHISHTSRPTQFALSTHDTDLMAWTQNGLDLEIWESRFNLAKRTPRPGSKNESDFHTEMKTCFDGLVIRAAGALNTPTEPIVLRVSETMGHSRVSHRPARKKGPFQRLSGLFDHGYGEHPDQDNSSPADYPAALPELALSRSTGQDPGNLVCVGASGKDLFLFVENGLQNTLFDFHMDVDISSNVHMFTQDIQWVYRHAALVKPVLRALERREPGTRQSAETEA
ncbi:MAG: hypothetical protein ACPGU7_08920 [Gammaproteobacteria bacterium]